MDQAYGQVSMRANSDAEKYGEQLRRLEQMIEDQLFHKVTEEFQ